MATRMGSNSSNYGNSSGNQETDDSGNVACSEQASVRESDGQQSGGGGGGEECSAAASQASTSASSGVTAGRKPKAKRRARGPHAEGVDGGGIVGSLGVQSAQRSTQATISQEQPLRRSRQQESVHTASQIQRPQQQRQSTLQQQQLQKQQSQQPRCFESQAKRQPHWNQPWRSAASSNEFVHSSAGAYEQPRYHEYREHDFPLLAQHARHVEASCPTDAQLNEQMRLEGCIQEQMQFNSELEFLRQRHPEQQEHFLQLHGLRQLQLMEQQNMCDKFERFPPHQAVMLQQAVHLKNLPSGVCTEQMMNVAIEQAGLTSSVVSFHAQPGEPYGEAFLTMIDHMTADTCVRHFNGCTWNQSGVAVSASFATRRPEQELVALDVADSSFMSELERTVQVNKNTERVLQALLAPNEPQDCSEGILAKKVRPAPPGLESNEVAVLAVPSNSSRDASVAVGSDAPCCSSASAGSSSSASASAKEDALEYLETAVSCCSVVGSSPASSSGNSSLASGGTSIWSPCACSPSVGVASFSSSSVDDCRQAEDSKSAVNTSKDMIILGRTEDEVSAATNEAERGAWEKQAPFECVVTDASTEAECVSENDDDRTSEEATDDRHAVVAGKRPPIVTTCLSRPS